MPDMAQGIINNNLEMPSMELPPAPRMAPEKNQPNTYTHPTLLNSEYKLIRGLKRSVGVNNSFCC